MQGENVYETRNQRTDYGTVNQLTLSAVEGFDFAAEVSQLDHRVLVLFGEADPSGMELAEETVAALQSADVEFLVLEKCGHFWHERPDQYYPRLRAFLGLAEVQEGVGL